jgi:hypothetical protein
MLIYKHSLLVYNNLRIVIFIIFYSTLFIISILNLKTKSKIGILPMDKPSAERLRKR